MTFGEKVKHARKKLMLSQEEMAKEVGVSFTTLNRWENSKTDPVYKYLRAFHDYCKKKGITFEGEKE